MLKRIMIMQAFTAMLVQLILVSTAMGITMVDAEQQVRARSAYMDDGIEYIAELKVDPEFPQGLGDANLSVSVSKNGADGSASLTSLFKKSGIKDQVKVSSSTQAVAQWLEIPEDADDVHGNGTGEFHLRFKTSHQGYIQINGLLKVDVIFSPSVYPEETCAWLRLDRIDDGQLTRIWTAALDGSDLQTSLGVDDVISLEADQEYYLSALAGSTAPAWWEHPFVKVRKASFSFTAIIDDSKEMPILPDLEGEFGQVKLKEPVNVGDKIKTKIIVTNNGFIALAHKQTIDIEICLRPCGVIGDAQDILVMTLDDLSVSSLQAGKSMKFNADIIVPADIVGGEYRLAAKVDSSNDVIEFTEINNTAISDCFEIMGN